MKILKKAAPGKTILLVSNAGYWAKGADFEEALKKLRQLSGGTKGDRVLLYEAPADTTLNDNGMMCWKPASDDALEGGPEMLLTIQF